jgi:hypothetical protein
MMSNQSRFLHSSTWKEVHGSRFPHLTRSLFPLTPQPQPWSYWHASLHKNPSTLCHDARELVWCSRLPSSARRLSAWEESWYDGPPSGMPSHDVRGEGWCGRPPSGAPRHDDRDEGTSHTHLGPTGQRPPLNSCSDEQWHKRRSSFSSKKEDK